MKSADYWKKRAEARMDRGMAAADAVLDQLERAYAKASRELQGDIRRLYEKYGDEYGLSYADAIKEIATSEYKDWRFTLAEYVERIRETGDAELLKELDTLATRARVTRLQTLETAIKVNTAELGRKGETLVTQLLGDTYENTYYRSAYDFQRGIGVGSSLEMLSPDQVAKAISYPWSGADYSSRIWKNAAVLEASLRETITQGLIQGKDIRQMTAAIQDATGAGVYNAQRLVRTETAYMVEAAELRSYSDSGVDEYEILVAEDERLCKKCGARSGDVHKVSDARVAVNYPPFHSNCRCTSAAHFSEEQMAEWEKLGTEAEQLSFAEWKERYVVNSLQPDIMSIEEATKETPQMIYNIGHLRVDYLEREFGILKTDEIIITQERMDHIKIRHSEDYEYFKTYGHQVLSAPDVVIKDSKCANTVFMVKAIEETNLNVVVRVVLETDTDDYKNSVITCYRLRDKNLKKLGEKGTILYRRE